MKKHDIKLQKFAVFVLLLSLAVLFVACGDKNNEFQEDQTDKSSSSTSSSTPAESAEPVTLENASEYRIIRSDTADEMVKDAVLAISDALENALGKRPKLATDFGGKTDYEILVGETKRTESSNAAAFFKNDFDYIIKLDGTRIVILGATSRATENAAKYFIENYISEKGVCVPAGDGYLYVSATKKDVKIGGIPLENFSLAYLDERYMLKGNYDDVMALAEKIGMQAGVSLELVSRAKDVPEGRIIYDAGLLDYTKGSISVEDGDLYLRGSYHSMPTVVERFIEMLTDGADITGTTEIDTNDAPNAYTRDELMDVLEYVYNSDDMLILGDEINNSRQLPSTFFDMYQNGAGKWAGTGKLPSIVGGDLGRCGLKLPTLPEEYKHIESRYICELIDYAAKGGIVTIGCHMSNPNGGYNDGSEDRGYLGDEEAWRDLVTEGTELNKVFKRELELDAEFLMAFKNAGVPVIWRPFHEMNGGWFWFHPFNNGAMLDARTFTDMWKYVYNYFTVECGLDNLVWCYSPNNSNSVDVLYCYPGDEYVDIMGLDWYTSGGYEIEGSGMSYEKIMSKDKLCVLAEMGISGSIVSENRDRTEQEGLFTAEDFMSIIYSMIHDGYKVAYLMTYNDVHSMAYLPHGDEVMASDFVFDLDEMPALFEKVRGLK